MKKTLLIAAVIVLAASPAFTRDLPRALSNSASIDQAGNAKPAPQSRVVVTTEPAANPEIKADLAKVSCYGLRSDEIAECFRTVIKEHPGTNAAREVAGSLKLREEIDQRRAEIEQQRAEKERLDRRAAYDFLFSAKIYD